jgi:hypothetical protein
MTGDHDFPSEVSWENGSWSFVVVPTAPDVWRIQTSYIVKEERTVKLPPYPGILYQQAGGDNDNTLLVWAVGKVDYSVWAYFGGGMSTVASFRELKPQTPAKAP